jgi:hypothetical protein
VCPMCIGAATWYVAGVTSAGGIAALVLRRSSVNNRDTHERRCDSIESKCDLDETSPAGRPGTPGN